MSRPANYTITTIIHAHSHTHSETQAMEWPTPKSGFREREREEKDALVSTSIIHVISTYIHSSLLILIA